MSVMNLRLYHALQQVINAEVDGGVLRAHPSDLAELEETNYIAHTPDGWHATSEGRTAMSSYSLAQAVTAPLGGKTGSDADPVVGCIDQTGAKLSKQLQDALDQEPVGLLAGGAIRREVKVMYCTDDGGQFDSQYDAARHVLSRMVSVRGGDNLAREMGMCAVGQFVGYLLQDPDVFAGVLASLPKDIADV